MWRQFLKPLRLAAMAAALLVSTATGCMEIPRPKAGEALKPRSIKKPLSLDLVQACTPNGIEQCFDAIDNNCNGIIDEGCGLRTGVLQFTIAWPESTADVDLIVTSPDGSPARIGEPNSAGLAKDRDCPGRNNACYGQNVENVYLVGTSVHRGRYRIELRLANKGQLDAPLPVRLSMRLGQHYLSSLVELRNTEPSKLFEFNL